MSQQFLESAVARTLILGATILLAAACSASSTEPTAHTRSLHSLTRNADDDPPDTPCRSGWINVSGNWVCGEP
jgi:hypothetical protein